MPKMSDSRASTPLNVMRCARGIPLRRLAEVTGIARSSLSDYLTGITPVPELKRPVIADALSVPVSTELFAVPEIGRVEQERKEHRLTIRNEQRRVKAAALQVTNAETLKDEV